MGEEWDELLTCMRDLRRSDVNILTLGQYLRPSDGHLPVARYYTPEEFAELRDIGFAMGFTHVQASPLTRSSYHAWEQARCAAARRAALMATSTATAPRAPEAGCRSRPGPTSTATGSARCCSSAASRRRRARPTAWARSAASATSTSARRRWRWAASPRCGPDDYITCSYREHGHALARGMHAARGHGGAVRQGAGCSKGKGGSMHLFDASLGFLGGHGIVGGHIPLATGMAFAVKYRNTDQVAVCYFGEAAVNNGAFHEALNMAALWKLPVHLHLREQPLRHGHRARAGQRHLRHLRAGLLATTWPTRWWTARTC